MKHLSRTLLALAASALMSTAGAGQVAPVGAFFDAMAIEVASGQQSRFVVGDGVDGYLDLFTQDGSAGLGYVTRAATLFKDYRAYLGDTALARGGAKERVLPYGRQVRHANGVLEELALISGQRAIVMRVSAPQEALLGIGLTLAADARVTRSPDLITLTANGQFMALVADRPLAADAAPVLRAAAPTRSLSVVAALGNSAEEAAANARRLLAGDAIGAERLKLHAELTRSYLATSDATYNRSLNWAKASARSFVVEEYGSGIWAGLPWFRDNWGRDTFIALPGTLLVSGQFAQAKAVLANFARYQNLKQPRDQEYGRIPNRISASAQDTAPVIYNTVDGTPWMLREALEYIQYTGDRAFARQMYALALPYFDGAIAHTDARGLLGHDSADTWMDARIEGRQPWSARGPYAVEIQALWHTALLTGARLAVKAGEDARAREWTALAAKVQRNFLQAFWDGRSMADRLREDGSRDIKLRPNQLMLVSIPLAPTPSDGFVPPAVEAAVTRNAVSALLYPYGIASLGQDDPYFHPRHENPAFHHKDAAYHNGTVWGWNAGFTVTALNKFGYQDLAWELTRNLGRQILGIGLGGRGTLGTMSELLDALPQPDGSLKPSGTYAQSWSVAEYARNGYQDFVGFRPRLLDNALHFNPAIPAAWTSFYARLPFGADEQVEADFARHGKGQRWTLQLRGAAPRTVAFTYLTPQRARNRVRFVLTPGKRHVLRVGGAAASIDGRALRPATVMPSQAGTIGTLGFRTPTPYRPEDFPMLKERDVLKGIVERNEFR